MLKLETRKVIDLTTIDDEISTSDWGNLQKDVLEYMLTFLPFQDVLECGKTCKWWNHISNEQRIWKDFYMLDRQKEYVITEDSVHYDGWCPYPVDQRHLCSRRSHYEYLSKKQVKKFPKDPKKAFIQIQITKMCKHASKEKELINIKSRMSNTKRYLNSLKDKKAELEKKVSTQKKAKEMKERIVNERKRKREIKQRKLEKRKKKKSEREAQQQKFVLI